jgi:uncharacterized membrane protein
MDLFRRAIERAKAADIRFLRLVQRSGETGYLPASGLLIGLALVAVVVIATHPMWATPQFLVSGDGRAHLFRLLAFDQTLRQGVVYPRWFPNLAFGYGYPILDFYPPLAVYLAEALHLLGLGYVNAIKGEFVIIFVLTACGAYVMGRTLLNNGASGKIAGVLAAVVYVFAPYSIYDVYVRGATTETLAAALLPWLIWSLHLAIRRGTLGSLVLMGMLLALQLLAHSLTLAIAAPFLGTYVLFELFRLPAAIRRQAFLRTAVAALLATGASAFYWLPFVAELPLVKMGQGANPFGATFQSQLLSLPDMIQSEFLYQYSGPVALGLATMGLCFLAVIVSLFKPWRGRAVVLLFGALAWGGAISMLKLLGGAWTALPFATVVQFPWRMMVLVDLGLSVTIGALPVLFSRIVRRGKGIGDVDEIGRASCRERVSNFV